MNNVLTAISYLCAGMAGVCLVGGIVILTGGKTNGNA